MDQGSVPPPSQIRAPCAGEAGARRKPRVGQTTAAGQHPGACLSPEGAQLAPPELPVPQQNMLLPPPEPAWVLLGPEHLASLCPNTGTEKHIPHCSRSGQDQT